MRIEKRFHIVILINIAVDYHVRKRCVTCVRACMYSSVYAWDECTHNVLPIRNWKSTERFRSKSMFLASSEICLSNVHVLSNNARNTLENRMYFDIFNFSWLFGLLCIERFESIVEAIDVRCVFILCGLMKIFMIARLPLIRARSRTLLFCSVWFGWVQLSSARFYSVRFDNMETTYMLSNHFKWIA